MEMTEPKVLKLPNLDKLRIIHYPNPTLKEVCAPIEDFTAELEELAEKMRLLVREAEGVGLAAPQVGIPIRLFVCNTTGGANADLTYVNPRVTESTGAEEKEEGCLSIPGVSITMRRTTYVVIEAFDTRGRPFQKTAADLEARIWQHEMDHLDGRLITDNMSTTDEIGNRRAVKQLEAEYAASRQR